MKELSLRQDPDLRKELAQLARGCDFVLPSRFKKRLRAFQQGQAGVFFVMFFKVLLRSCRLLDSSKCASANWNYCKCWRGQDGMKLRNFFHVVRPPQSKLVFPLVSLLLCLKSCRPSRATCHSRPSVLRREHSPVFSLSRWPTLQQMCKMSRGVRWGARGLAVVPRRSASG